MKLLVSKILAFFLVALIPFFTVGCGEDETVLSFTELSTLTLEFDTDVRPFFSTLTFKYNGAEGGEIVKNSTESINGLSYEMGESFKVLNSVMAELELNQTEESSVASDGGSITIKNESLNFVAKMNENRTNLSITLKNNEKESVYEIIKKENGGYFSQVAVKNNGAENYTVYQISYVGTSGKLAVGFAESGYTSIFGAEISDQVFPTITEYVFTN